MYLQKSAWSKAKKQTYKGFQYDSGFEAGYAIELDQRQKAGDIVSWERQVNLSLAVNGYEVCKYRIDFIVHHHDGTTEYVETKGYATPTWRLKWKLFEALYSDKPNTLLTVVKQKNNFNLRKIKKCEFRHLA